jgi:endo-1,4-beta-xylanase
VTWCKAQGITTKGHPLAWNYVEPRWLKKDDPENAMQLQLQRVARCAKTFAGDIDIWDVVNEATHYDREFCRKNAPTLTQAIDDIGIGEYVRRAFVAARQANPKATLLINDYRVDPSYEQKVIHELVDGQGKALYDVIGIQSHMHNNYWGAERTWRVCDTFAKYNVPLHFTETTVVSGPKSDQGWVTTAAGEETQAEKVAEFYTLLFSQPAVEAITWWDFTDQNAWQSAPAGLIREDMSPKPAYDRLYDLIKGKWWTKVDTHTMAAGKVTFSGFHGDYRISASINGEKLNARFSLRKHADKAVKLRLS